MLSDTDYIKQSLALHLFFARIMKEHSFFLEISFTPKMHSFPAQADLLRKEFDALLNKVVRLSNGVVAQDVLDSGEVVTPYTLDAERLSAFYTGIQLQFSITEDEVQLEGGSSIYDPNLEQMVNSVNNDAIRLITSLIQLKTNILNDVLSCKLFTVNYPLLIEHILREAKLYLATVQKLQNREELNLEKEAYEQEYFWNRIMAEHSKFIRGLLDPTENELIIAANDFGNEFDELTNEARAAIDRTIPINRVTVDSINATRRISDFNEAATQGLLNCKIRSIIIPLLGDHVLRESNHYLRLLSIFEQNR